jgi:copper/silver efflux system protein
VIARWIDLCARNRFLVFTGTLLLVLAGIWAERRMPLDALPDISDVQVIIHTAWNEPPNVIEDQVTYPIVTALLAALSVKAVRAQTMFGDSYVFVVFEDGTDLYWARSRVLEYLQQIAGRLPAGTNGRGRTSRPCSTRGLSPAAPRRRARRPRDRQPRAGRYGRFRG